MKTKVVCFGEMLWDILPGKELPGGAVMNVAYNLHKLGENVSLVSRVGNDLHGRALLDMLTNYGLDTSFVQVDEVYETGKVYADTTDSQEVRYHIVHQVSWDNIRWEAALANLLQQAANGYFVFGSLSSRHHVSLETLEQALTMDMVKVLDINLREPHYTRPHIAWLLQQCNILKLNMAELELISSWYGQYASRETAIRELCDRFDISTVVVTMGSEGALLFINNAFHYQPGIPVKVADTIGSGDAFLAGLLHSFIQHRSAAQSLAFANALGALVASYPGGCPPYKTSEIAAIL